MNEEEIYDTLTKIDHYLEEVKHVADGISYIGPMWQTRLRGAVLGIKEELIKIHPPATKESVTSRCIP